MKKMMQIALATLLIGSLAACAATPDFGSGAGGTPVNNADQIGN